MTDEAISVSDNNDFVISATEIMSNLSGFLRITY